MIGDAAMVPRSELWSTGCIHNNNNNNRHNNNNNRHNNDVTHIRSGQQGDGEVAVVEEQQEGRRW
jgi:hypothetical protein